MTIRSVGDVVPCGLADTRTDRHTHTDRRRDMTKTIVADNYLSVADRFLSNVLNKTTMSYSILTLLNYLLTSWCRVLLEQLTGLQLVMKFPAFHGTRRFITAPTSVRHLSLSWASPIQSIYPHPASWRSILLLSTHLPYAFNECS